MAEPRAGETFYGDDSEEFEIAEVVGRNDPESEVWRVVDEDGEEANIKWNAEEERWEVDA